MDDIARAVCEGQARNEYLVDQLHPLQRVRGKQDNVITIEVRVLWQKVDGREYWHRPYVTTVAFAELRRKPDALWRLLTRCLPFKEWKFVDWSVGEFEPRLYSQNDDDEPLSAEEQGHKDYWWDGFGQERLRKWVNSEYPDKVANMKEELRELVSDDHGVLYLYESMYEEYAMQKQVCKCWFVISAVGDGS